MYPGMAVFAEGNQVLEPIVGVVAVDVVYVQFLRSSADGAAVPITLKRGLSGVFPPLQAVFVPRRNPYAVEPAEELALRPVGEGAPVAELPKAVPVGIAPAERPGARVERTEIQLYLTHAGSMSAAGVKNDPVPGEKP